MNGDRLYLQSQKSLTLLNSTPLGEVPKHCYPWANVCVFAAAEVSRSCCLSEWKAWWTSLERRTDWALAWRSDCQKGNIRPAEVDFCPAQSSSSKHLGRRKQGVWAGESEPQRVIDIIHIDHLITSMLFSRLDCVWWSAWNISCHYWLVDYATLLSFLCFPCESEQGPFHKLTFSLF